MQDRRNAFAVHRETDRLAVRDSYPGSPHAGVGLGEVSHGGKASQPGKGCERLPENIVRPVICCCDLLPIKQLIAILYLRISGILDLDPRLTVLAFLRFHDNAFEIEVAHEIVEVHAVVRVINVEKMRVACGNEFAKDLLTLQKW